MPETHACDYCRAATDPASDVALITRVHRHVDPDVWAGDPDLLILLVLVGVALSAYGAFALVRDFL